MKDVSIIIPTYNRPNDLDSVLPYYLKQKDALEIIIVDDCSTLSYEDVISSHQNDVVPIIYCRNQENKGAGGSRNVGLTIARGKYVLWGEDDAFLSDDYIDVLKSKMVGKMIVVGSIYYGINSTMTEIEKHDLIIEQQMSTNSLFNYHTFEGYYRLQTLKDEIIPWGHALFLVAKEAYMGIEYYEGYKVNGYREETDAQVQMTEKGYTVLYTSDTCCYHFPAKNKNGGQHSSKLFKFEFYKILNNNIFLDRHFQFLKKKYQLDHSVSYYKIAFGCFVIKRLFDRFYNSIKRRIR